MSDKINNGELMTGGAINAKSEALELHELSSEELDAVSGGTYRQAQAMRVFQQALESL